MNWQQLLSTTRFRIADGKAVPTVSPATAEGASGLRSDFHIDHDRVVFSSAFRRLGRKTQVHPLASHDHTHNRLTHSVEVSSVGRSLGNRVGAALDQHGLLPAGFTPFDIGAIVQVACLAHDIGNPPFGHTGEDALRVWFRDPAQAHFLAGLTPAETLDVQTYEGNAHGFRMVAALEMYEKDGGMRLTAAALGALMKYPWTVDVSPKPGKFNLYQSELPYFEAVAESLGLPELSTNRWARHPLSYLMEAADDICYAILDLEDAVEIGILDVHEFERLLTPLAGLDDRVWRTTDPRQKCALLRGTVVGKCVTALADRFMAHHDSLMHGQFAGKDLLAVCPEEINHPLLAAKDLASRKVYRHRSKVVTEVAAYPCMATILNVLIPGVHTLVTKGEHAMSTKEKIQLSLLDRPLPVQEGLYACYMTVLDYVGSMTDNAAAGLAREVSGVGII
ncbi:deoxyguanosinetriphosphate triphosphohydrolase [Leeia sp. TBRC 13508]|uniref:Deoxyguanosinetriphosphate triphosphohydrolase n=1 Tax=Leeia speluncae TaxID=2884804 RepID=A0ABS8D787_9NEIS|nr:deoxyguanosinetriphosphate triphosphohydrolase [Leeia speluncae]MCB6184064.1 deoxyguanosinetriphosphate triphosphohydrolase [Leeia speluncae]